MTGLSVTVHKRRTKWKRLHSKRRTHFAYYANKTKTKPSNEKKNRIVRIKEDNTKCFFIATLTQSLVSSDNFLRYTAFNVQIQFCWPLHLKNYVSNELITTIDCIFLQFVVNRSEPSSFFSRGNRWDGSALKLLPLGIYLK